MDKEHVDRVQVEVERVMTSWCDAEPGTYNAQKPLEGLWLDRFGTSSPYVPRGIVKLVNKIRDNQYFEDCNVSEGLFMPGGGVQTVGDLTFFLGPCGRIG